MKQAKHCNLCKHPIWDLPNGLKCGLTDQKPNFKNCCPEIEFSESFINNLTELMNEIDSKRKRTFSIYLNFVILSAIGILLIIGGYPILDRPLNMRFDYIAWKHYKIAVVFMALGILPLSLGIWSLIKHIRSLKSLDTEKEETNRILSFYKYDIDYFMKK